MTNTNNETPAAGAQLETPASTNAWKEQARKSWTGRGLVTTISVLFIVGLFSALLFFK